MTSDPYGLIASGLPPELAAQAQGLTRRQAIMQAILAQSQQPLQNPTNPGQLASQQSLFAPIAQMAKAYMGSRGLQEVDKSAEDLRSQQQKGVAEAMLNYEQMKRGSPSTEIPQISPMDEDGNPMPAAIKAATKGDPRAAVAQALSNPYLQNNPLVKADLDSIRKAQEPYSLRQGEQRMQGSEVVASNAPKPTEHVINGKVYVAGPDGQMQEKGGPGDSMAFSRPFNADGTPNKAYQAYELSKAHQGATRVQTNVNTGADFYKHLQAAVGDQVAGAAAQARGAVGTLNTVGQIREALDSGKVIAGPGTTAVQWLGQVGQVMGVSGKDATEQLTNTRSAIQGLAQLELDAAQQMKGQGAITEAERGIIKRAAAGDIDSMTVPEMRMLTDVMDRSARYKINLNSENVKRLKDKPGAKDVVDFMDIQAPEPYKPKRRASDKPGAVIDFGSLPP